MRAAIERFVYCFVVLGRAEFAADRFEVAVPNSACCAATVVFVCRLRERACT
jgi:hypothetical protein